MELIQIYNRATNTWSDRYTPYVGYQENYVLDKTTDTAKDISFKYVSDTAPTWGITDWVRILHVNSAAEAATYDANGRPVNSTQYIISDIEKVQNLKLGYWQIKIVLAEPIERFQGVIGETLTYTNQGDKAVYDPDTDSTMTYSHAPYNYYTALERWLKVTPANCDNYDSGYSAAANRSWFNRIKLLSADKALLTAITFADTTLNAVSLYELLLDNYDAAVGRTPVAYFDINPSTDLPYNSARDEYLVIFERQDGFGKDEITLSTLKASTSGSSILTGFSESASLDNYATGLVSDVENLAIEDGIDYPNQNTYAVPEVNADVRKLFGDNSIYKDAGDYWIIKTPFPIKKIISIKEIGVLSIEDVGSTVAYDHKAKTTITDRTPKCYEYKEYTALPESMRDNKDLYYYKEGDNIIHCEPYRYIAVGEINTLSTPAYMYYITYQPYINPRVIIGSEEYSKTINTTYSQVDSKKFAGFLDDYLKGMNKADVVIQKTYYNYNDFSELIGTRVIDGEKEYMITNVSYRNRQFQYEVFLQLNENHVRKNNNYQAPGNVQKNAAIETSNIKERKICINNKIKIGLEAVEDNELSINITRAKSYGGNNYSGKLAALSALVPGFLENYTPQSALVIARSTLKKVYTSSNDPIYTNSSGTVTAYSQYESPNIFSGETRTLPVRTLVTPLDEYCYTVEGDGAFLPFGTWYVKDDHITSATYAFYHFFKVTCVDIAKFAFGNKICLNVTMPDNAVAGKTKTIEQKLYASSDIYYTTYPKYQLPVLYTDYFGEIQEASIVLLPSFTKSIENIKYNVDGGIVDLSDNGPAREAMESIAKVYKLCANFPELEDAEVVPFILALDYKNLMLFADRQKLYKDQLERLNETFMFEIDGGKDIIVCDNLAKNSRLMVPANSEDEVRIKLYYQKLKQEDISQDIEGYQVSITGYDVTEGAGGNYIEYSFNAAFTEAQLSQFKSIVISQNTNLQPLLIINKISDIMKTDLANGKLKIYY